jgi:hypothetical protein
MCPCPLIRRTRLVQVQAVVRVCFLHDFRNFILDLGRQEKLSAWPSKKEMEAAKKVTEVRERPGKHHADGPPEELTSVSSRESCWDMHRKTFFLLLSCISPARRSSSRM